MRVWLKDNLLPLLVASMFLTVVLLVAWMLIPALALPASPTDNVPTLVAALALVGVFVTAAVTLIGILFKQSNDVKAARWAEAADRRATLDQRRLQMETALQTVQLLTTSTGAVAPPEQVSAALIVLSKLGETRLAIDLAAELWPKGQISPTAAVYLCDAAFASSDEPCQHSAALLLYNNWPSLRTKDDQVHWLSSKDDFPDAILPSAKSVLVRALTAWLHESPALGDDFRVRLLSRAEQGSVEERMKELSDGPGQIFES